MIAILLAFLASTSMFGAPQATTTAVRIEASDTALTMPSRITAGRTSFTFENHGSEPHEVRFMRLDAGHTFENFVAWSKTTEPIPAWLVQAGGLGAVGAGKTEEYTASLVAGSYVALCSYPTSDDKPHFQTGMFAGLRVDAGPATTAPPPAADLTITMHDHQFQLSAPVPDGRPVWHLRNAGSEPHQALVVKLPEGANEYQERAWFTNGSRGGRTGEPIGGGVELAPGAEAWFRVELTPGRYLLLCTVLEQEGRHFDLGMIYRFTIG